MKKISWGSLFVGVALVLIVQWFLMSRKKKVA